METQEKIIRSSFLYSDHGGSNKVYNIFLVEVNGEYLVNYQNGKKGATLTPGTKTKTPVDLASATKIFDRLEKEKRNGDSYYRPIDADMDSYVAPVGDRQLSGLLPQLLTDVDEESLDALLDGEDYIMQQKYDGERLQIAIEEQGVMGSNKLGFVRGVPEVIRGHLSSFVGTELDSEIIGNTIYVFDILKYKGQDLKGMTCEKRIEKLNDFFKELPPNALIVQAPTYNTPEAKRLAFERIKENKGEGVVFKKKNQSYLLGRSKVSFRYKFTASATCIALGMSKAKRSLRYGLLVDGVETEIGRVTLAEKEEIPAPGALIEIKYLYALPKTHALFQARYKGERSDQVREACTLDQLKYKSGPVLDGEDEDTEVIHIESGSKVKRKPK